MNDATITNNELILLMKQIAALQQKSKTLNHLPLGPSNICNTTVDGLIFDYHSFIESESEAKSHSIIKSPPSDINLLNLHDTKQHILGVTIPQTESDILSKYLSANNIDSLDFATHISLHYLDVRRESKYSINPNTINMYDTEVKYNFVIPKKLHYLLTLYFAQEWLVSVVRSFLLLAAHAIELIGTPFITYKLYLDINDDAFINRILKLAKLDSNLLNQTLKNYSNIMSSTSLLASSLKANDIENTLINV